jgi:DNA ligase-1
MRRFAEAADAIAATASKLDKTRLLAGYLGSLDAERLPVATRWFAGRVFPPADGRTLQVGGAALFSVLRELSQADDEAVSAAWRRHADAGDVTGDLFAAAGHQGAGLDLLEVLAGLDRIASTSGARAKTAALADLLRACTPSEAKYVVKLISGDMRIGLREGLVEEAVGRAFERSAAAVARANMVTGDLGVVALLARDDALDQAAPALFSPLRFMLASPVADAAEVVTRMGEEVWVEDKYDGIRCQLHREGDRIALFSRDLHDVTVQFPEVAAAAERLSQTLILDGELLAMRDGRVLPFSDLQTRLGRKQPPQTMLESCPVVFVAWDVLLHDGESLLDHPLRERRALLEAIGLGDGFALAHQEHAKGVPALEQLFADARARLNEGLIAKDPDSAYSPGRRGLAWLKLKKPLDTIDVVVTGAEWGNGKRRHVLSDVTFAVRDDDTGELVTVGKAYTGLTDVEIAEMTQLLQEITLSDHGHFRSVEPRIVLEIAFDRAQRSARHKSGYALRFPRIVHWRHDKGVADIDMLSKVRAIAEALESERVQLVDRAE